MKLGFLRVIQFICVLLNIPGVIYGSVFSVFCLGLCLGLFIDGIIWDVVHSRADRY